MSRRSVLLLHPPVTSDPPAEEAVHWHIRFTVEADCSPCLLPRILQPFARRDLIPDQVRCVRATRLMRIEITTIEMPIGMVHLIEGNLRQIIGVRQVTRIRYSDES